MEEAGGRSGRRFGKIWIGSLSPGEREMAGFATEIEVVVGSIVMFDTS